MPPLKTLMLHGNEQQQQSSSSTSNSTNCSPTGLIGNNNLNGVIMGGSGGGSTTTTTTNNGSITTMGQQKLLNERRYYISQDYSQKLLINLNKLREDSSFCDVDIIAGNNVFSAHRAVLSASSAYFEAMFRPELGLSERTQKSVTIHSITPEILKMLIDFIYTGHMEITQVSYNFCSCEIKTRERE